MSCTSDTSSCFHGDRGANPAAPPRTVLLARRWEGGRGGGGGGAFPCVGPSVLSSLLQARASRHPPHSPHPSQEGSKHPPPLPLFQGGNKKITKKLEMK